MAKTEVKATLEQRVLRFIREQHMVSKRQKVVVAVSGGPDSVCLLHVLSNLQKELGVRLHVAHLDHQLRGPESEADARYVSEMAGQLSIPATIEHHDVQAYQVEHRISLEEAAREVRYTFLARVAESIGADRAAVGHTSDDHLETILMHLIRGTGTRGLRGLQPISRVRYSGTSLTVIRPLLQISRQETADYCHHHQLAPRIDASNLSLSPLRNRIRLQLMPLLQSYNPQVSEALLRTARIASDELDFLDKEAARLWGGIAERRENTVIFDKEKFLVLPPAMKRHLLRASIEKLLGGLKDIETRHIEEIIDISHRPAGRRISLPEGLIFTVEYDKYLLGSDPAALSPFPVLKAESPLKIPGKTRLPGWCVEAAISDREQIVGKTDNLSACFDFDKVGSEVSLRCHQPGDRFQPLGMSQAKKLSDFMIDAKIPRAWRQRVPIVCSPEQILWVVGWRIDERAKVNSDTKKVLYLRMERQ